MKQYKLTNNILGWIVFAIAAFTYCMTVEPSASFWDCPEFIASAYKMEVGHAPGAPFFMLTGNFFSLFAKNPAHVALMINTMSALLSALCILFLFWTITHLTRMLICENGQVTSTSQIVKIMGAGAVGALCYTWSDTFWFSAVEGEVYAYSSMFTALVFWLILKWEDHADEPHSDRWLVLIAYLTGLSIGVHLLNLLCLPAIALVYYYKRNPQANLKGSMVAAFIGFLLVAAVLFGLVPGIVKVGGWFELFFVNSLGFNFNVGMIIYLIVLITVVITAIWSTTRSNRTLTNILYMASVALLGIPFFGNGWKAGAIGIVILILLYVALTFKRKDGNFLMRKRLLNTSLLCMLMLMIGYSTYAIVVIRSVANPPMDQNSPEDIFSLGSYLSREQYGQRPLLIGPAFSSYQYAAAYQSLDLVKKNFWHQVEKIKDDEHDSYESVESNVALKYPKGLEMLFPRIYSQDHTSSYYNWLGDDVNMRTVTFQTKDGQEGTGQMPSQWDNFRFFMRYQINFMYWRYFMWNFSGRQNGYQGNGDLEKGNWITGIPVIDNLMYGDQNLLPKYLTTDNNARNVFFLLPALLGCLGIFAQSRQKKGIQQFWVIFFLFFMTGLAIILYLNQTPNEPRERDYAYAGSFYAFAIWIGIGVVYVADVLEKIFKKLAAKNSFVPAALATGLCLLVPIQMVSQTWDDHDRSGRYICRDFGLDYMDTMPKKLADGKPAYPIIFTNGDNETFPLWYNQEVEGKRTDARVCNLQYLQTEWYTDQMMRPAYSSPPLPINWKRSEYVDNGKHSYYPVYPDRRNELDAFKAAHPNGPDPYELSFIIDNYVRKKGYIPTDSVVLKVNKANVLNQGITVPEGEEIPDYIPLSLQWAVQRSGGMYRSDMMIYEMLARNDWKRPMYMSVTLGYQNFSGLQPYLALEGLAYRITPFNYNMSPDTRNMQTSLMKRYTYGNLTQKGLFLDETNLRMCQTMRRMFLVLAQSLLQEGKQQEALEVLKRGAKEIPSYNVPYENDDAMVAQMWQESGDKATAIKIADKVVHQNIQFLQWAEAMPFDRSVLYAGRLGSYYQNAAQGIELLKSMKSPKGQEYMTLLNKFEHSQIGQSVIQTLMQDYNRREMPEEEQF